MESSNYPLIPDDQLRPEQQLSRLNEHAGVVQAMVATPGWAVFVQAQLQAIKMAKDQAGKVTEPHRMAMLMGAALAMEDLLDWPRRELEKARLYAKSIEIDKQKQTR